MTHGRRRPRRSCTHACWPSTSAPFQFSLRHWTAPPTSRTRCTASFRRFSSCARTTRSVCRYVPPVAAWHACNNTSTHATQRCKQHNARAVVWRCLVRQHGVSQERGCVNLSRQARAHNGVWPQPLMPSLTSSLRRAVRSEAWLASNVLGWLFVWFTPQE